MKKGIVIASVFLFVATALIAAEGQKQQAFPARGRTIEIIVPYSAGGGTDRMGRILASFLQKEIGNPVVVVDKPGAAGEVGMTAMNQSKPDGYTLGLLGFPDNCSMAAYKKVSYDNKKFQYLAAFTDTPTVLVVKKGSPFKNLQEFVDYARANPGKLTLSESGDSHLITIVELEDTAGIKLTHVNYDGAGQNFNAILGGHVDAGVLALLFAKQARDQGLSILAIASSHRSPDYPNIPTFKELGYNVRAISSRVLTVPVGTPQSVVDKLKTALDKVGQEPDFINTIKKSGEVFDYRSGSDLQSFVTDTCDSVVQVVTKYKSQFVR